MLKLISFVTHIIYNVKEFISNIIDANLKLNPRTFVQYLLYSVQSYIKPIVRTPADIK